MMLRKAIERISHLMIARHDDALFQDLLLTSQRSADPRFGRSIATLFLAISANESGNEQEAIGLSRESERGFSRDR